MMSTEQWWQDEANSKHIVVWDYWNSYHGNTPGECTDEMLQTYVEDFHIGDGYVLLEYNSCDIGSIKCTAWNYDGEWVECNDMFLDIFRWWNYSKAEAFNNQTSDPRLKDIKEYFDMHHDFSNRCFTECFEHPCDESIYGEECSFQVCQNCQNEYIHCQ